MLSFNLTNKILNNLNESANFQNKIKDRKNKLTENNNLNSYEVETFKKLDYGTLKNDVITGKFTNGKSFTYVDDEIYVYPDTKAYDLLIAIDSHKATDEDYDNYDNANDYYNDYIEMLDYGKNYDSILNQIGIKSNIEVDESALTEEVETITKAEFDKIPDDYKSDLKDTLKYCDFRGENKEDVIKKYTDLGYDMEKDKMILSLDKKTGSTVLKPVKIID